MTWHVWQVSPFITSIFFILGVFTLYQVLYDWLKSISHYKNLRMTDDQLKDVFGILYMLIFIFSMQATIVGKSISWEFMNFQIMAIIFCAYFLNIRIPYRYFIPIYTGLHDLQFFNRLLGIVVPCVDLDYEL